jgi:hypothetical protein
MFRRRGNLFFEAYKTLRKPCRKMKNQGEAGKKEGSAPLVHPFMFYNKRK